MLTEPTKIRGVPFRGGCVTSALHKSLLPFGGFSMVQNIVNTHSGMKKRKGCRALHSTADSTNEVMTLFQYSKDRVSDTHFISQMGDSDFLEATNDPPTVTTGVFGSELYSGTASPIPASYGVINDLLIFANGVDPPQIYAGSGSYVDAFIVYDGSAAPPNIPMLGEDYSVEVSDGKSTTVAVLDSLDTYANNECIFFRTPVQAKSITVTVSAANGNAATASVYYRKNDSTWAAASGVSDGTSADSKTLAQTGTISWTVPTDEIPSYAYGNTGFWYQIRVSAQLDSEVEVSSVTFAADCQDIVNVWDGVPVTAPEVQVETGSGSAKFATYSGVNVSVSALAAGAKVVIASADPIEGIYFDVGSTPNTSSAAINTVKYWDGVQFATVGTVTDDTSGLQKSGWMTFARKTAHPHQFNSSLYAYWYEVIFQTAAIDSDITVEISLMPYFDVSELGNGRCVGVWKDRALYSFDYFPQDVYVSRAGRPMVLNGDDFAILRAGDGRGNKVVNIQKFHNEVMFFQQEVGSEGGSLTLYEGYSPTTFGKLVLSSKIGTFSSKSVAVVDGVMVSTASDESLKTLVFFLSHYGVCVTDGKTVSIISDDIQNYFDPDESECIRRGYEDKMWLAYSSKRKAILCGLVSGGSASVANVFPVFDLVDKTWSFDSRAQALSCYAEVEGQSGNVTVIPVGGGTADGTIYQLDYGTNDVSTAIDSYVTMEFDAGGEYIEVYEALLRCTAQAAGDITLTLTENEIAAGTKTLSMTAAVTNHGFRRHRFNLGLASDHISMKVQHNTASQTMELLDFGFSVGIHEGR